MQDKIRQLLKEVYDQHGAKVFDDRSRMTGILSDQCGGLNKEIKIIGVCIGLRIPGEIMQMKDHVIEERDYRRWLNLLIDGEGMNESLSAWAIEVLAETLGRKISAEAPKAQVNIRKVNALSADIRSGKEFDPDKPVPDFSRDAFETPEEYKARIESSGWILCGHALLNKNDYNVESCEWKFKVLWQDWAKAISGASFFTDNIHIQRDEAIEILTNFKLSTINNQERNSFFKKLFKQSNISKDNIKIPVFGQIQVREKLVYFSKMILQTEMKHYPVSSIDEPFIDIRDGKKYKIVKIGSQIWMAENLNYQIKGSVNYRDYGSYYTWEAAKKVVPPGWHLPSKNEFEILLNQCGGRGRNAYYKLISGGESGFNALFGGWCYDDNGNLDYVGSDANFWSSTEYSNSNAWSLDVYSYDKKAYMSNYSAKDLGFSVRCIKD